MLFIRVCELVIELFSKIFFKLHFFKPLLNLSADPVPNIRLCLCNILPRLKSLIKLPKDSQLLQELESCVKKLISNEKDKDVSSAISKAIQELDKIEVTTEPLSRRSSAHEFDLDLQDWQKEIEERHLLELEFNSKLTEKDKTLKSSPIIVNINKGGRIPIRKSGTLPKPAKARDVQCIAVEKIPPGSQKSLRNIKKERRISSPGFSPEIQRNILKCVQTTKNSSTNQAQNASNNSSSKCSIPSSRPSIPTTNTWPRQKRISTIPKQTIDRCPSPMPASRSSSEQSKTDPSLKKESNLPNLSPHKKANEISTNPAIKENVTKQKAIQSLGGKYVTEVKRRIKYTPSASPEILRKSATFSNLSSESKIPTSNPRRRSTIKD